MFENSFFSFVHTVAYPFSAAQRTNVRMLRALIDDDGVV